MRNEIKGLNEECGVFGVFGVPEANRVTYFGLHNLQHRGQEGAGIVTTDGEHLYQHRDDHHSDQQVDLRDLHLPERLYGSHAAGALRRRVQLNAAGQVELKLKTP